MVKLTREDIYKLMSLWGQQTFCNGQIVNVLGFRGPLGKYINEGTRLCSETTAFTKTTRGLDSASRP